METATRAMLRVDVDRFRAQQYATSIIHELKNAGYIADCCVGDAMEHMAYFFHRHGVIITTAEQRHADSVLNR